MSSQGEVNNLIDQAVPATSPLNQALKAMVADMYRAYNQLFPANVSSRNLGSGGAVASTNDVTGFTGVLQPTNLHLTWNAVQTADHYEIRYQPSSSTNYDTAIFLISTPSLNAEISPFTIPLLYGTYTFLIKAVDVAGTYSNVAASITITIPVIGAPSVNSQVIGNNVLLFWTIPSSSLAIDHYVVSRNGSPIGNINGTFDVIFEAAGGTYDYTITPVDIVGNVGTASPTVTLTLSNPTDFQFQASLTSTLNGTLSMCVIDTDGTLFACMDPSISYENHFILGG